MAEQLNLDPSYRPVTNMVFGAIKTRTQDARLTKQFVGGVTEKMPLPRSPRPYLVLAGVNEFPLTQTNVSVYYRVLWTMTVVADSIEQAGDLAGLVKSIMLEKPLVLNGGNLQNLRPPSVVTYEELELKRAQLSYEATVKVPRPDRVRQ